jgi:AAA+ ATPase superfamily predicted ATPase
MEPTKRFRIALSFAGEKRAYVAKVAAILARQFGKKHILYDKYHRGEFARGDLAFYLPDLYEQKADLVVVVFCPDYDKKLWCGLEWNAIYGLLIKRKVGEVMLTRFGGVEGKGLRGLAGYTDLDELTAKEAASVILERLAVNEGRPQDYYTEALSQDDATRHKSIPNNLPRLQHFYGRRKQRTAIRGILNTSPLAWGVLIDGPGGMGKTSLAVRAAYDCRPGQFDRIIFISVKNRSLDDEGERKLNNAASPEYFEILRILAGELGEPQIVDAPREFQLGLIRGALGRARILLVLDNLETVIKNDRDRLFELISYLPNGCKAILTSRRDIGSTSDTLRLGPLDETAAFRFFKSLARNNDLLAKTEAADWPRLYAETNGNPLLLRWTCGQLGRGECRTIKHALAFLRKGSLENDPLEFVFGDLANDLTPDAIEVLGALAQFSGLVRVKRIAKLAGLKEEAAESALRFLTNRSLVIPDVEERFYKLAPTLGSYLRRKWPEWIKA